MKTLADLCKPRASVFDKARLDTVYNLDDLSSIHPDDIPETLRGKIVLDLGKMFKLLIPVCMGKESL